MQNAQSYEDWVELAKQHDELSGMERWRFREQSDDYDYHEISMRLHRLKQLLGRNDHAGLLFALNEGIHGNMGGMGNPILYNRSKYGTKQLISDYIETLAESIERVVSDNCDDIPVEEKLDFSAPRKPLLRSFRVDAQRWRQFRDVPSGSCSGAQRNGNLTAYYFGG